MKDKYVGRGVLSFAGGVVKVKSKTCGSAGIRDARCSPPFPRVERSSDYFRL
jgi:hypothetical protein